MNKLMEYRIVVDPETKTGTLTLTMGDRVECQEIKNFYIEESRPIHHFYEGETICVKVGDKTILFGMQDADTTDGDILPTVQP